MPSLLRGGEGEGEEAIFASIFRIDAKYKFKLDLGLELTGTEIALQCRG